MNRSLDSIVLRYAGYCLVFVAVGILLYLVRGALPVFMLGLLIAYALEPLLQLLERRGSSRVGAVAFVFAIFILLMLLVLALLASAWQQALALTSKYPVYERAVSDIVTSGREHLKDSNLPANVRISLDQAIAGLQTEVPNQLGAKLKDFVTWLIGSASLLVVYLVILPIVTLWFMLEMGPIRGRLLVMVPPIYRGDVVKIASSVNDMLGRYVRGQAIVCSLYGLLCTVAFYTLQGLYGMEYALILGILAALIYIVPYLGMITIAIAAGSTAYLTADSQPVSCAASAVGCCVMFNLIIDYIITPRIVGRGVGLHPLMVIFALLSGAQVGGIFGMVLAVPVFASLRVVAIYVFPQLSAPLLPAFSHPYSSQARHASPAEEDPIEAFDPPVVTEGHSLPATGK